MNEAERLAEQLRDLSTKFKTPSHEKGVCNGAIQELRRLSAINAELVKSLELAKENAEIAHDLSLDLDGFASRQVLMDLISQTSKALEKAKQ